MAREVEKEYIESGQVRLIYVDFVVHGEPAALAAEAAHCAGDQDAFWEYHDMLYESQSDVQFTTENLKGFAKDLDLDTEAFATCLDENVYQDFVAAQTAQAQELGLEGTPTLLVNQQLIPGLPSFQQLKSVIEAELAKQEGEDNQSQETPVP